MTYKPQSLPKIIKHLDKIATDLYPLKEGTSLEMIGAAITELNADLRYHIDDLHHRLQSMDVLARRCRQILRNKK